MIPRPSSMVRPFANLAGHLGRVKARRRARPGDIFVVLEPNCFINEPRWVGLHLSRGGRGRLAAATNTMLSAITASRDPCGTWTGPSVAPASVRLCAMVNALTVTISRRLSSTGLEADLLLAYDPHLCAEVGSRGARLCTNLFIVKEN